MSASGKNSTAEQLRSTAGVNRRKLPPLKSLLAFEAASRHGSFAQGAEELGVTPSAVSHHIQLLEDFLGVKLFQRHAGRALLTSAGRVYGREMEHAFGVIADATTLVAPQSQLGHLVIACGPSFAAKWLQPRLAEFLRAHPDMKLRITTLLEKEDLDADRFDVAIAYALPRTTQRDVEPLLVERLRPLCSPALAASIGLGAPQDLSRATLIHSANALTWSEYLRRLGQGDLRPAHELWLDRSSMAIEAAVNGLGVVLESEILVEQELRDGRLIAPFDHTCSVEVTSYYLVKPQGFRSGDHIAAFERWLRAALAAANLTRRSPSSISDPNS
jgi:LysR family glycine cleavage system transcriptional activator